MNISDFISAVLIFGVTVLAALDLNGVTTKCAEVLV